MTVPKETEVDITRLHYGEHWRVGTIQGHTVRFSTLAAALTDLLKQESLPALERRLRRYVVPDVLLLDEVGYLPCDSRAADMLYAIVDRRHEKRSTVVTTNLCEFAPTAVLMAPAASRPSSARGCESAPG